MNTRSCWHSRHRWPALAAGCLSLLLSVPASALSPELLVSTTTQYDVYRDNKQLGEGKIELKPAGTPDCWSYSQEAYPSAWLRWLSGDILEQSHVCVVEGQLRPVAYRYNRSGVGSSKENFSLRFDWPKKEVVYQNGDIKPLTDGIVDRLSMQLVLRDWLLSEHAATGNDPTGTKEVKYVDRKKIDSYVFQIKAHEDVKTPAGTFKTVRLDRIDNDKRRAQFWLSPDNGYIVVKAEQQKEDDPPLKLLLKKMPTTVPANSPATSK